MYQYATISRLIRKPVADFKPVVLVDLVCNQVTTRCPQADEHFISNYKGIDGVRIFIHLGHIDMPTFKISSIE